MLRGVPDRGDRPLPPGLTAASQAATAMAESCTHRAGAVAGIAAIGVAATVVVVSIVVPVTVVVPVSSLPGAITKRIAAAIGECSALDESFCLPATSAQPSTDVKGQKTISAEKQLLRGVFGQELDSLQETVVGDRPGCPRGDGPIGKNEYRKREVRQAEGLRRLTLLGVDQHRNRPTLQPLRWWVVGSIRVGTGRDAVDIHVLGKAIDSELLRVVRDLGLAMRSPMRQEQDHLGSAVVGYLNRGPIEGCSTELRHCHRVDHRGVLPTIQEHRKG